MTPAAYFWVKFSIFNNRATCVLKNHTQNTCNSYLDCQSSNFSKLNSPISPRPQPSPHHTLYPTTPLLHPTTTCTQVQWSYLNSSKESSIMFLMNWTWNGCSPALCAVTPEAEGTASAVLVTVVMAAASLVLSLLSAGTGRDKKEKRKEGS